MSGGLDSPIPAEAHWRIGEDRDLWFPVYEELLDKTRVLPTAANTWTTLFVLRYRRNEDEESPLISKAGAWDHDDPTVDNGNGTGLAWFRVPILRSDTVSLKPGRYFHSLARTNVGAFRVLAEGYAELLHAATR